MSRLNDEIISIKPAASGEGRARSFHIPSLDGVRAVAFAIVAVSHVPELFRVPGGLGVTIFFFLSGYLITTLLRRELAATGRISVKNFYVRRVLRIFPPMYLTLAIGCLCSLLGMLPWQATGRGIFSEAVHLTNYFLIAGHDREVVPGQRVYWSLAVEEHFYLCFPLCSTWLLSIDRGKAVRIVAALCALVLAWRIVLVLTLDPSAVRMQYATDTRIDSILFGVIMAIGFNPVLDEPRLVNPRLAAKVLVLALCGVIVTILAPGFFLRETVRYTVQGLLLMPIFYVLITRASWPVIRWLNSRPVRYIGLISYTLYLVHDSLFQLLRFKFPQASPWLWFVLGLAGSSLYAVLMRQIVEVRLLAWRRRFRE